MAIKEWSLREQAARFRRLAHEIVDERTVRVLLELVAEYEARADEAEEALHNSQA